MPDLLVRYVRDRLLTALSSYREQNREWNYGPDRLNAAEIRYLLLNNNNNIKKKLN